MQGISLIVLTKDRPDLFLQCVQSVPDRPFLIERLVVQHGTDAETERIARDFGWTVLGNGRNNSFAAGNNLAAAVARGSHLFLLNNDARLAEGCLDALWRRRAHPIVGCVAIDSAGRVGHAGIGFLRKTLLPAHIGIGWNPTRVDRDRFLPSTTFAAVLIASDLWEQLGGLCEDYWYSYEDVDFCARALERGVLSLIAHDAVVYHDECATRDRRAVDSRNARIFRDRWIRTRRLADALGLVHAI